MHAAHPEVKLTKVDTQVDNTIGNFHSAMETLIEGAVLAVIVVFLFLRDIRATIVSAIALPLSAIPTFWAMSALGFSLNLVTLLAITLVTGILVDDAIVEVENIVRHMRMGKSAYRASLEAADEIGLAVIAISMTIVAVFAPVSFMGGIAGQYFRQFGLTVAVAVLFSLLVARLITPVVAAYFMRSHAGTERGRRPAAARLHPGGGLVVAPPLDHAGRRPRCCSSARLRRPSCCRPASYRLRTSPALCSRSNCRRARGSRIPTRSRARISEKVTSHA